MKLNIDRFLALTAVMATAQLGTLACVVEDSEEDDTRNAVEGEDDAGVDDDEGETDDDTDPGEEGDDDDTEADAGSEDGVADDGERDAGSEEGIGADAGVTLDAGEIDLGDAAVEADPVEGDAAVEADPVEGDAGSEDGVDACFGGSFEADIDAVDCEMFDSCIEVLDYAGTALNQCWEMTYNRRASVYGGFIQCVLDAELLDPCDETADLTVSDCAWQADMNACADPDDGCTSIGSNCAEVPVQDCDALLAPYDSVYRSYVAECFDGFVSANPSGPNYEGCGIDFQFCALGPGAE